MKQFSRHLKNSSFEFTSFCSQGNEIVTARAILNVSSPDDESLFFFHVTSNLGPRKSKMAPLVSVIGNRKFVTKELIHVKTFQHFYYDIFLRLVISKSRKHFRKFSILFCGRIKFLDLQDYKQFVDAENLMQFPVNESKNPVCMEMKALKPSFRGDSLFNGAQEIGSIGSSDTYASCNTQPFNSQADLTEDSVFDPLLDNSNVYINPLQCHNASKSAYGNAALRSLGASPMEETCKGFGSADRGSRGSLNDSMTAKNWRTRFQKVILS